MIIAIDGPAASGKSTTAKLLADKIKFIHLNTGLLYRAVTYAFIKNNLINKNNFSINDFFKNNHFILSGEKLNKAFWNDSNITEYLLSEDINKNINYISNDKMIREYLVSQQRILADKRDIVCEGRDIGTVVFPKADYKFFLSASLESRINRRYIEMKSKNHQINKDEIKNNLIKRDKNDIERKNSPLLKADDAIEIDTTSISINKQVLMIYNKIKQGISE